MNIKVSIIIPAYNIEKYIEKCIKSAINQTIKDIEIIVVNDGSTDGTLEIINKFSKIDNRIKIINKKNGGVSSARNIGFEISFGEYIQYIDGDDWIEQDACEILYDFAIKNDLDMVVSDFYYDDRNNLLKWNDIESNKFYTNIEYLNLLLQDKSAPSIWNKFIKREIHENILFSEKYSYGEDLSTVAKLAYQSKKIGKLDKAFIHYIFNPNSITNASYLKKGFEKILACHDINEFLKNKDEYPILEGNIQKLMSRKIPSFITNDILMNSKSYNKALYITMNFFKFKLPIKSTNIVDILIYQLLYILPYKYVLIICIKIRKYLLVSKNFIKEFFR